jgi:nucleoporin GLE1
MLDLAKDLEQVRLHNTELKLVRAYERRAFYENLDRLDREREEAHDAALSAAAARRDALRREAEEILQQHLLAVEEERKRKEENERRKKEKMEREKEERERREREISRLEAEKRAKEEAEKRKVEEAERAREAIEEKERKERQQKERQQRQREHVEQEKKKLEEERQKSEQEAAKQKAVEVRKETERLKLIGAAHRTAEQIAEHQRYLELHHHLKKFRRYMVDETKKNPILKQHMGDMRRTIKKCVGQLLTEGKIANRTPVGLTLPIILLISLTLLTDEGNQRYSQKGSNLPRTVSGYSTVHRFPDTPYCRFRQHPSASSNDIPSQHSLEGDHRPTDRGGRH